MALNINDIENRLWDAADELRANSKLKASEYSVPVLGLLFLRYADHRFTQAQAVLGASVLAPGSSISSVAISAPPSVVTSSARTAKACGSIRRPWPITTVTS